MSDHQSNPTNPTTTSSHSNTYQYNQFDYQLNEVYLRPLLDKHNHSKLIQYEDLIHSWNLVEQMLKMNHRKGSTCSVEEGKDSESTCIVKYDESDKTHVAMVQKVS